jgi:MoxR-like ATPase
MDGPYITAAQTLARRVVIAPHVQDYAIRLVLATHPGRGIDARLDRHIRLGASPRGAQALVCAAKVRALLEGRYGASFADIEAVALPALRHRVIRSFEAQADGASADDVVRRVLEVVPH